MATGKPRFYWDTAPLIAWIADEARPDQSEMDGLAEVVEMVGRESAILMTSVLWRAEVSDMKMSASKRKRLEASFDGRRFIELSIDGRILDLASEIRGIQRTSKKKDVQKNIRTPDAIHLATAIIYDATEFHTFDGAKSGANHGGLLSLNGDVGGHRLKICVPRANQLRLAFPAQSQDRIDDID